MKIFKTAMDLYQSKEFRSLRRELMHERADDNGVLKCEYCGKPILKDYECIAHHEIEVTAVNLNNPEITLNPANLKLVHLKCHNEIHGRFGYSVKKVYLVHGAPCAGKNTFVNVNKSRGDLVIDIDLIWEALTGGEMYDKPDMLTSNVFGVYNELLSQIKMRVGNWRTAYIISAEPFKTKRDRLAAQIGAECIYIPCTKEKALQRLYNDDARINVRDKWTEYINNYFEKEQI